MTHFLSTLSSVSFFGRPYGELLKCFGLDESELIGKSVLECPAGPSSFVAEANQRGIRAIGIDPLFYRNPEAIATLAYSDFRSMFERVRRAKQRFSTRTYASVEEAEATRLEGLQRFVRDYRRNYGTGCYRVGSLPKLDFDDRSFDAVLCAHFLFIYSDQFDRGFHLDAMRELCRVAREQVRIHPIVDATNGPYPHLDDLLELVDQLGFDSCIHEVDHEFFKGTNRTLTLRRRA
ncbi:hypothetical protein [Pelagicoccus sp. SDUM812003]|uniref:class I SAM-dependent methyltransferase n=1 Tax=Pelagicoccus sp. SDUM812003 TaxID=3041267 RepID=UPI00280C91A3|nr:hypothetical protein [Pelagicoccus sp. SDUM812003]MDQ8202774.1 hypothetical protein [Pelagicoccus sp. SDUM812003]